MYLKHFQLSRSPFQTNSDPAFLWYGEKHKEALDTLRYGLQEDKSYLLLTGDIGLGKTSIINALLGTMGKNELAITISDPALETIDFFNYLAVSFGMPKTYSTKGGFLIDFRAFLLKCRNDERSVLLIIDESQRLTSGLLEEIRMLADIEADGARIMKVFFVGQTEFNVILTRPENKAIRQRITINYNLEPLTLKETAKYLSFRLIKAGAKKNCFDKDAVKAIHHFSKGYPRLINIIADRAMITAFIQSKKQVNSEIVRECGAELDISRVTPPHGNNGALIREAMGQLESVDAKTFRSVLDKHGLARSSIFRMVLTRIHRAASDPKEFHATIVQEAKRLTDPVERDKLKAMMATNDVPFIKPLLKMLHTHILKATPEKPCADAANRRHSPRS